MPRMLMAALGVVFAAGVALGSEGNSANAQLCQKGGFQALQRSDGSGFDNEGDCTSYAARGGVLQSHPASISVTKTSLGTYGFTLTVQAEGLKPGSALSYTWYYDDGVSIYSGPNPFFTVAADGTASTVAPLDFAGPGSYFICFNSFMQVTGLDDAGQPVASPMIAISYSTC